MAAAAAGPRASHGAEPRDHLKAGLTRHPLARRKHPASGVAPTHRPRTKFCLYRSVAMPSGRATACSDCHQSTVSCAVLCAPFRAHLARQTRHHVTLSRPVRFRWQPVRPWRCSGPGQLPSHRPGGAAACRVRRQCAGDTGVLPSQGHVAVRTLWATAISTPGKWIYWPPSLPCTERCTESGQNARF